MLIIYISVRVESAINDNISISCYYIKKQITDTKKYVYEGYKPSYHEDKNCKKLRSDYTNYKLPVEICAKGDLEIERFRNFVKDVIDKSGNLPNNFEMMAQARFFLKNSTGMTRLSAINSGVEQESINSESLEKTIDNLLFEACAYKYQTARHTSIIDTYGYNTKQPLPNAEDNRILLQWHEIKSDIKRNLTDYFMIRYNPSLNFCSSFLEQLNFKRCSTCSINLYDENNNLIPLNLAQTKNSTSKVFNSDFDYKSNQNCPYCGEIFYGCFCHGW